MGWGNVITGMQRVLLAAKLAPPPAPVIPSLLCFWALPLAIIPSGIWHLYWFLPFILLVDIFSFSPQRASLIVLPSQLPAVWFCSLSSSLIQLPNFLEAFSPLRHLLIALLDSKTTFHVFSYLSACSFCPFPGAPLSLPIP